MSICFSGKKEDVNTSARSQLRMLGIDQKEQQSQPLAEIRSSVFVSFLDRNLYKKIVDGSTPGRGDQTTKVVPESH